MELRKIFASRLKSLRKSRKVTQAVLAKEMGVALHTIKNWERAMNFPYLEMLCKIANYFDVSIDYLLGQTDNPARNR